MSRELPAEVAVELDAAELGGPVRVGTLRRVASPSGAVVEFAYDEAWLARRDAFVIDPAHGLYAGVQYPQAGGSIAAALREHSEATAAEGPNDVETPAIEGHDRSCPVAGRKDDVRCVRDSDVLVGIALDDRAGLPEFLGRDGGQVPGAAGQLAQHGQLGRDAEPRCNEIVKLSDDVRRNDERLGGFAENGRYRMVIGLVCVKEREERAGVDDHRSPKPGRCSSASRAIGAPLENRAPRGRGRSSPTALRIELLMTSASETPRLWAARLIADLSSAGR